MRYRPQDKKILMSEPNYGKCRDLSVIWEFSKFVDKLVKAGAKGKDGAAFGSYGWSGEAPIMIAEKMRIGGINVLDPVLRVQYKPNKKDLKECNWLGKDLAEKIKK